MLNDDDFAALKVSSNPKDTEVFKQISAALAEKNEGAKALRTLIEATELLLAQQKDDLRRIEEEDMPQLMDELGVRSVVLSNGQKIDLDISLHAAIVSSEKPAAHAWLRDEGHEAIIKNEMIVKAGKNEGNSIQILKEEAEKLGLSYEIKESVNTNTLKAFVREQTKAGVDFPPQLFNIFIRRTVNTK